MRKILKLFIIIFSLSVLFSMKSNDLIFDIKYIGTISSEGDWGYYAGAFTLGPYFIDNNSCVYIDDFDRLIFYSLKTKEKKVIEENIIGYLDKIGNSIYLIKNKDYYIFKDLKLIKVRREINLFDSYYYNDTDGIYIIEKNKKNILVPNAKVNQYDYYFVKGPIYDGVNLFYLATNKQSSLSFDLIKYDIKEKKEIFLQKVRSFALLPNDKDYILINAIGGSYSYKREFPDDFYIINKNNGKIIYNFDQIIFNKEIEITIISFDVNKDNDIVAFGDYSRYVNKANSCELSSSENPVIIFKLINSYNNTQIKNNYFRPTVSNLRFREIPNLKGKYIRSLKQGEKLELIEKGKTETINGTKGTWVKVKTEKGEVGWCFDAYLEEVKKK